MEVDGAVLDVVRRRGPDGAPVLVLIHSLGCDKRVWDAVAERLTGAATVIAYDIRGHGLSAVDAEADLDRHAADALSMADGPLILCGLSIGGQIAMAAALTAPERVRGLVVMDSAARIGSAERYAERAEAVRHGGVETIADAQIERWFSAGFRIRNPGKVAALRAMLARQPPEGYLAGVRTLARTDLSERIGAIACPVLCLCGSEDASTPPEDMARLAAAIPAAAFHAIDGAGHLPPVEAPDAVADRLRAFLRAA
jgi:3-oxoadipate enol-lactonase